MNIQLIHEAAFFNSGGLHFRMGGVCLASRPANEWRHCLEERNGAASDDVQKTRFIA
ncbi:hypothetical protein QZM22_23910 [Burkholderia oklahomensis]|uniref:hypothetical protein n=1 Tax=Burkholderia oklahomensis TaxID=342113 RepID=UPI0026528B35|nr:hypothetical protein [Burkholderia oklahomensis]MDN7675471.1 hypothetical protein [Burkholderia oklahomensis]